MKNMKNITTTTHLRKLASCGSLPQYALLLALTTGCGGSSTGDDGGDVGGSLDERVTNPVQNLGGPFQNFAYFDLISDDVEDRVNYDANFLQMVESQPASVFANSVPPAVDKCNLRVTEAIPTDVSVIGFPNAQFNLVSAGETFTLTGDGGVYAAIARSEGRFEVGTYPIPEPLTLDIPGDEFPAATGLIVPNTPLVTNLVPNTNDDVTADTVITWTPSGVAGHSVFVHLFDFPQADRVVDFRCRMADDGSFALSDNPDIIATLNATLGSGFALTGLTLERQAFTVSSEGDTLIVVSKQHQTF